MSGDTAQALAGAQPQEQAVLPSEAIYGFAAWITCRDDPVTLGAGHDAAPATELVEQYRLSQGWAAPRGDFCGRLRPSPAACARAAAQTQEPAREPSDEEIAAYQQARQAEALADLLSRLAFVGGRRPGDALDRAAALLREQAAELERLRAPHDECPLWPGEDGR